MKKWILMVIMGWTSQCSFAQIIADHKYHYSNGLLLNISGGFMTGSLAANGGLEFEHFMLSNWISYKIKVAYYQGTTYGEIKEQETLTYPSGFYVAPGVMGHFREYKKGFNIGLGVLFPLGYSYRTDKYVRFVYPENYDLYHTNGFLAAGMLELNMSIYKKNKLVIGWCVDYGTIFSQAHPDPRSRGVELGGLLFSGLRIGGAW